MQYSIAFFLEKCHLNIAEMAHELDGVKAKFLHHLLNKDFNGFLVLENKSMIHFKCITLGDSINCIL